MVDQARHQTGYIWEPSLHAPRPSRRAAECRPPLPADGQSVHTPRQVRSRFHRRARHRLQQILPKIDPKTVWGMDEDTAAFGQFTERYITLNDRWNSPKFILGETYGTPRSAMLVDYLQNRNTAFNGVSFCRRFLTKARSHPHPETIYLTRYICRPRPPYIGTMTNHQPKVRSVRRLMKPGRSRTGRIPKRLCKAIVFRTIDSFRSPPSWLDSPV